MGCGLYASADRLLLRWPLLDIAVGSYPDVDIEIQSCTEPQHHMAAVITPVITSIVLVMTHAALMHESCCILAHDSQFALALAGRCS